MNQVPKEAIVNPIPGKGGLDFTGAATRQNLVTPHMGSRFSIANINFARGVRNKFHTHSGEQILIVTAGRGVVATDQEKVTVEPGDVIHILGGEKHWHGATPDSEFSHLSVTAADVKTTQVED